MQRPVLSWRPKIAAASQELFWLNTSSSSAQITETVPFTQFYRLSEIHSSTDLSSPKDSVLLGMRLAPMKEEQVIRAFGWCIFVFTFLPPVASGVEGNGCWGSSRCHAASTAPSVMARALLAGVLWRLVPNGPLGDRQFGNSCSCLKLTPNNTEQELTLKPASMAQNQPFAQPCSLSLSHLPWELHQHPGKHSPAVTHCSKQRFLVVCFVSFFLSSFLQRMDMEFCQRMWSNQDLNPCLLPQHPSAVHYSFSNPDIPAAVCHLPCQLACAGKVSNQKLNLLLYQIHLISDIKTRCQENYVVVCNKSSCYPCCSHRAVLVNQDMFYLSAAFPCAPHFSDSYTKLPRIYKEK